MMKNKKPIFKIIRFLLLMVFLFPKILFAQSNYDGFIICVDNFGDGDKNLIQYYYIPLDFLKNNELFTKESMEYEDDKLEPKVKAAGGLKIYKEIYFKCSEQESFEVIQEEYERLTLKLFYFHYFDDNDSFPKINKAFFLKKIKRNKYYVAKIRFKACKKIDRNYLKSKIHKIFVYEIDDIKVVDDIERKKLIKFIEDAYLK